MKLTLYARASSTGGKDQSSGTRDEQKRSRRLYIYDRNIGKYLTKFSGAPLDAAPPSVESAAMFVAPLSERPRYSPWSRDEGILEAGFQETEVTSTSKEPYGVEITKNYEEFVRYVPRLPMSLT